MKEMYGIVHKETGEIRSNYMSTGPDRVVWEKKGYAEKLMRSRNLSSSWEVQKIYLVPETKVKPELECESFPPDIESMDVDEAFKAGMKAADELDSLKKALKLDLAKSFGR